MIEIDSGRERYRIKSEACLTLKCLIAIAVASRLILALIDAYFFHFDLAVNFGFTVIFPAVLCMLMLAMPPTRSSEGILMRVGAIFQFILIICLPLIALPLLLGLPVMFFLVEVLETWLPCSTRDKIKKWFVQC